MKPALHAARVPDQSLPARPADQLHHRGVQRQAKNIDITLGRVLVTQYSHGGTSPLILRVAIGILGTASPLGAAGLSDDPPCKTSRVKGASTGHYSGLGTWSSG